MLLLPFGRDGGVNHDTAEWWQFMGHTLHLALYSVSLVRDTGITGIQASPRSSFVPSLGSPIEEGREGRGTRRLETGAGFADRTSTCQSPDTGITSTQIHSHVENTRGAGINPSYNSKLSGAACPGAETSTPSPLPEEGKPVFPSVPAAGWAWTD